MKRGLRRVWWMLLVAVALGLGSPARAQDSNDSPRRGGNPFGFGRLRAVDKNERDHETVRVAFRDVVNEPHRATVSVMADGRPACLGCIVDAAGYIVTKASELDGAITVKLHEEDKRVFDAKVVGTDTKTDLAMLKIDAENLPVIAWRDQNDVPSVGSILASPGLENLPVAIGVVSVAPRTIRAPSGILGVGLEEKDGSPVVSEVSPNSGAEKAGIKPGDVVLTFNGEAMNNQQQLRDAIGQFPPGQRVFLKIKRGDQELSLSAVLRSRGGMGDRRGDFQNQLGGPLSGRRAGFELALQHDTILTPQECGGPLVDLDGRCVGINIARAGRVNSYALPVSVVMSVLDELKAGKRSPTKEELLLAQRREELKQLQASLAAKLTELVANIQALSADANQAEQLKKAEAERLATEDELGKIAAELAKIDPPQQTTTVQK